MRPLLIIFLIWALGSFIVYKFMGTDGILPYAGLTIAAVIVAVLAANRKKA